MHEEPVILDGDERVLQVRRDRRDRHVVPLLVETKPAAAIGGVKPRVADAARQLIDRITLRGEPAEGDRRHHDEGVQQVLGPGQVASHSALTRSTHILHTLVMCRWFCCCCLLPLVVIALMPLLLIQRYRAGSGAPASASVGGDAAIIAMTVLGSVLPCFDGGYDDLDSEVL